MKINCTCADCGSKLKIHRGTADNVNPAKLKIEDIIELKKKSIWTLLGL